MRNGWLRIPTALGSDSRAPAQRMEVEQAERWTALLRPIRDAALAFEVDVSAELEEYIEHCVRSIGPIDETNLVNFAEAGLLLQGSALILGRKVEHLHALVYKALEKLRTQRSVEAELGDDEQRPSAVGDLIAADEKPLEPLSEDNPILRPGKKIDVTPNAIHETPIRPIDQLSRLLLCEDDEKRAGSVFASCVWRNDGGLLLRDLADYLFLERPAAEVEIPLSPPPHTNGPSHSVDQNIPPPTTNDISSPPPARHYDDVQSPPMKDYTPSSHAERKVMQSQTSMQGAGGAADDTRVRDVSGFEDPYAEFDMHESAGEVRPAKRGKHWKLPSAPTVKSRPRKRAAREEAGSISARAALACSRVATDPERLVTALDFCKRRLEMRREQGFEIFGMECTRDNMRTCATVIDNYPQQLTNNDDNQTATPMHDDNCEDGREPISDDGDDMLPADDDEPPPFYDEVDVDKTQPISDWNEDRRVSTASSTLSRGDFANLARRVAAWQEHLEPLLKSREERAPFDAKRAGLELAGDLKVMNEKQVPFAAITNNLPRYEVCRRFLAALQLANEGRVNLHHTNNADQLPQHLDFRLTLLDRRDDHLDQIDEEEARA